LTTDLEEHPAMHRVNPEVAAPTRRLTIVSGYGRRPLTPRGRRTQQVREALSRDWDVELVALPAEASTASPPGDVAKSIGLQARLRRWAVAAALGILLDRREPWSARRFLRWRPDCDAALLIATPWSPAVYAARRLRRARIPYVIDCGDPWALTATHDLNPFWAFRARRAERAAWRHAAGAVVTTDGQSARLRAAVPSLPVLVRPNGYDLVPSATTKPRRDDPKRLRLVHFGLLNPRRVKVAPLLGRLLESGLWQTIEFTQFGEDYEATLDAVSDEVEVKRLPMRPWSEVLELAGDYDAAVVVGNPLSHLMPSKAVQYLTLPIPRIALTNSEPDDALRHFVDGRPAWIVLSEDQADAPERVRELVGRDWSAADLRAPESEAWPQVARQIADFIETSVAGADAARPATVRLAPMEGRS
jgi:Glycosyl transferase 4-like domain